MVQTLRKILAIEAIRGFAAIYVVLGHIVLLFQPQQFYPNKSFLIKTLFGYGHEAVILFFIVSGFSIHYSSSCNLRSWKSIKDYLFKRFRRIYPLFFISLLFALIVLFVLHNNGMKSTFVRNILSFLFLTDISKGSICNPISSNPPIWSLSYEVIYYLLYPILIQCFHKYGFKKVLNTSFLISLLFSLFCAVGYANHLANVFQLYWIWVAGAVLAEYKMKEIKFNISGIKGLIFAFLAFALTLEKAFIYRDYIWAFFFLLVISLYFIPQKYDNQQNRFIGLVFLFIAILINYGFTLTEIVYHKSLLKLILPSIFILGSLVSFVKTEHIQSILRTFSSLFIKLGSFSYALYIFHWPLLILFVYYFKVLGIISITSMLCFIILFLFIINISSWWLEVKLQPRINKWLNEKYYPKPNLLSDSYKHA